MHLREALELVEDTPQTKWVNYEVEVPRFLEETYLFLENFFENLYLSAFEKLKAKKCAFLGDRREKSIFKDKSAFKETFKDNFFVAGGYISDLIISNIHNTPFTPRDIDFFVSNKICSDIVSNLDSYDDDLDDVFYGSTYDRLGKVLKNHFPDCTWKDNSDSGYPNDMIDVVYRFTHKGSNIELVVANPNRIINFDLSFRCAYYNQGIIYVNETGLNDIRNKVLRVFHSVSPVSTLLRLFHFKIRYGYEIDELSLILLLSSINAAHRDFYYYNQTDFYSMIKKHHKATPEVLEMINDLPTKDTIMNNKTYNMNTGEEINEDVILKQFILDDFRAYNKRNKKLYPIASQMLSYFGSLIYPRVETFLKSYIDNTFKYKRPDNWLDDRIFENDFRYKTNINGWLSWTDQEWIKSIFRENDFEYEYLTTQTIEIMKKLVLDSFKHGQEEYNLVDYNYALSRLPLIARSKEFKLTLSLERQDLWDLINHSKLSIIILLGSQNHWEHRFEMIVDTKNKILKVSKLKYVYFGFSVETYQDFISQIKKSLGLDEYAVQTHYDIDEYLANKKEKIATSPKVLMDRAKKNQCKKDV
ncbi:hypothetical protein AAGG74_14795 [Bacillus mexicanus]|uniref:hypothetical protein n=1 Tax=Bacillus mexicanus TaxID=2834415 RepID=UPI003D1E6159